MTSMLGAGLGHNFDLNILLMLSSVVFFASLNISYMFCVLYTLIVAVWHMHPLIDTFFVSVSA